MIEDMMKKIDKRLGAMLQAYREEAGFIKARAAEKIDVSLSYISQCESGILLPTASRIIEFIDLYGLKDDQQKSLWEIWYDLKTKNAKEKIDIDISQSEDAPVVSWDKIPSYVFNQNSVNYKEGLKMFRTVVNDDSMKNEFLPGENIYIDPGLEVKENDFVIVVDSFKDDVFLCQFQNDNLKRFNANDIPYKTDRHKIIGVVVKKIKHYKK